MITPKSQEEMVKALKARAEETDALIAQLNSALDELEGMVGVRREDEDEELRRLQQENVALKRGLEVWKEKLRTLEVAQGIKQIPLPTSTPVVNGMPPAPVVNGTDAPPAAQPTKQPEPSKKSKPKKEKKPEKEKKSEAKPAEDDTVDVGRLDFRIGVIVSVAKHPDADSLYVETVDVGEEAPRTVVSGLVGHVQLEELQNRTVVLLCNLKPAKMRGVTSQAMVMCASSPEKVEILIPPRGSQPGDRISFQGYISRPDTVLNPKKKIWETVAPDLKTGEDKVANYKGVPFEVSGKGVVVAPTLINVQVK